MSYRNCISKSLAFVLEHWIRLKHLVLLNFLTGLNLEVELLVRAHECHTLACNMEGIAAVLRNGRLLTTALAETREYMLMVTSYSVLWNIKFTKFNEFVHFASLVQRFVKVIIRLPGCYPTLLVFVSWIGLWETDYQTKLCAISQIQDWRCFPVYRFVSSLA